MLKTLVEPLVRYLPEGWRTLAITDLLLRIVTFLFLFPVVGILFRFFLMMSGRDVLADTDIARFLLHPIGWTALLIVGASVLSVFAIELSALLAVCLGAEVDRVPIPRAALQFAISKAKPILITAFWVVANSVLLALPFLAVGGGIFLMLLTEHDINFYLSERPPVFLVAIVLIAIVLIAMAVVLFRRLCGWVYATPLVLFESMVARSALTESLNRSKGVRPRIAGVLAFWGICNLLLRFVLGAAIIGLARWLVGTASDSMALLVLFLGILLILTTVVNLVTGLIANATLASALASLYVERSDEDRRQIPNWNTIRSLNLLSHLNNKRIAIIGVALLLGAALLGIASLNGIQFDEKVEVTAHRGGAVNAPENTLAAVLRGIEDGADWIEIDVQESSDGEVLVIHDSDLMKVAANPTKVWDATAADLRDIDIGSFFDPKFSDQRIPTLEEVLLACRGKAKVNIELKYYGHDQDLERKVVEIVERNEMSDQIVVMSLEADGIAKIKALRPEWTAGLLTAVVAGDLTRAPADFLAVKDSIATEAFVTAAHLQGKSVSAWTLNDGDSMSLMISRGVDNLITDRPALARRVIEKRKQLSAVQRISVEIAYQMGVQPEFDWGDE